MLLLKELCHLEKCILKIILLSLLLFSFIYHCASFKLTDDVLHLGEHPAFCCTGFIIVDLNQSHGSNHMMAMT